MNIQTQVGEVSINHASAVIQIDDGRAVREYQIFASKTGYVTIATGNAIKLRSPGKTFHNVSEIETHYKRHGKALLEIVNELNGMINDCRA